MLQFLLKSSALLLLQPLSRFITTRIASLYIITVSSTTFPQKIVTVPRILHCRFQYRVGVISIITVRVVILPLPCFVTVTIKLPPAVTATVTETVIHLSV
jgi:hypothetical protein